MKPYLISDMICSPNFEMSRIALCKKEKKINLTSNSGREHDLFFLGILWSRGAKFHLA